MDYKYLDQRSYFNYTVKPKTGTGRLVLLRLLALFFIIVLFVTSWFKAKQIDELTMVFAEEEPSYLTVEEPSILAETELAVLEENMVTSEPEPSVHVTAWNETSIKKGDTLLEILNRYSIVPEDIKEISNLALVKKSLRKLQLGHSLKFMTNNENHIEELAYEIDNLSVLLIKRENNKLRAEIQQHPVTTRAIFASGIIKGSLSHAAKDAKIPRKVMTQLAQIFAQQINFARDVKPGDKFNLIYQKTFIGDEELNTGAIVAAEFENKGKLYQAIRFETPNGETHYYSPRGEGLEKAFVRFPVKYSRVSSQFNPGRLHPILHIRRPHLGVDFSAPAGTPVKATSEGKVLFAGRKSGYGNMVTLDHGEKITTIYAHLKKTATGLKTGNWVKRGDVIGYVGSTGLATGPHLHYEFRVNNKPHNPLTVKLPQTTSIPGEHKAIFNTIAKQLISQLDAQRNTLLAQAETKKQG